MATKKLLTTTALTLTLSSFFASSAFAGYISAASEEPITQDTNDSYGLEPGYNLNFEDGSAGGTINFGGNVQGCLNGCSTGGGSVVVGNITNDETVFFNGSLGVQVYIADDPSVPALEGDGIVDPNGGYVDSRLQELEVVNGTANVSYLGGEANFNYVTLTGDNSVVSVGDSSGTLDVTDNIDLLGAGSTFKNQGTVNVGSAVGSDGNPIVADGIMMNGNEVVMESAADGVGGTINGNIFGNIAGTDVNGNVVNAGGITAGSQITINNTYQTTFNGAIVGVDQIDASNANTANAVNTDITFKGNVTANTLTLSDDDGTAYFEGTNNTVNVVTTVDGNSNVNIVNGGTFTGSIGQNGTDLAGLTVGSAAEATTITGSVYANDVNVDTSATTTFSGQVNADTLDTSGAGGTVNLNSNDTVGTLNVNDGDTLNVNATSNSNIVFAGANSGTVNIGSNAVLDAGATIATATDGVGNVNFNNTSNQTISQDLGTATNSLASITAGNAVGVDTTFTGEVNTTNLTAGGNGVADVNITTIQGNLNADNVYVNSTGALILDGSTVNVANQISVGQDAASSSLAITNNANVNADIYLNGSNGTPNLEVDNSTLSSNITTNAANSNGFIEFNGGVNFTGSIDIFDSANASNGITSELRISGENSIGGSVNVGNITFASGGNNTFSGDVITGAGNSGVSLNKFNSSTNGFTDVVAYDIATFGAGSDYTFNGDASFFNMLVSGSDNVFFNALSSAFNSIELNGNGSVTIAGTSATSGGSIKTNNDGQGTVNVTAAGAHAVNIGDATNSVADVNIAGGSTMNGDIYSTNVDITSAGDTTLNGVVDAGSFNTFGGATANNVTFNSDVQVLDLNVNANDIVTLNGNVTDTNIDLDNQGNAAYNPTVNFGASAVVSGGSLETINSGTGTVGFNGGTQNMNIGSALNEFAAIALNGGTNFSGNVFADSITFTGAGNQFNGDYQFSSISTNGVANSDLTITGNNQNSGVINSVSLESENSTITINDNTLTNITNVSMTAAGTALNANSTGEVVVGDLYVNHAGSSSVNNNGGGTIDYNNIDIAGGMLTNVGNDSAGKFDSNVQFSGASATIELNDGIVVDGASFSQANSNSSYGKIDFAGNGTINSDISGASSLEIGSGFSLDVSDGVNVDAAIFTETASGGTVNYQGSTLVTHNIGEVSKNLSQVNFNSGIIEISDTVGYVGGDTIDFAEAVQEVIFGGSVQFGGNANFRGNTITISSYNGGIQSTGDLDLSNSTINLSFLLDTDVDGNVFVAANPLLDSDGFIDFSGASLVWGADSVNNESAEGVSFNFALADQGITTDDLTSATCEANACSVDLTFNYDDVSGQYYGTANFSAFVPPAILTDDQIQTLEDDLVVGVSGTSESVLSANDSIASIITTTRGGVVQVITPAGAEGNESSDDEQASLTGTGLAAGGGFSEKYIWGQAFGKTSEQDERKGFAGYDFASNGFVVGADTDITDNTRLGLALSYTNSDVDLKSSAASSIDINSYQATVYGSYTQGRWYVDGTVGFAINKSESQRSTDTGTAKADFDNKLYSTRIGSGYSFAFPKERLTLTPEVSLQYNYLDQGSYTEDGAGANNLSIANNDIEVLKSGLDVSLAYTSENGKFTPEVHAGWNYDFIGDAPETTLSGDLTSGQTFTLEGAKPAQSSYIVGLGANYKFTEDMLLNLNYDYGFKDKYDSHTGIAKVRIRF